MSVIVFGDSITNRANDDEGGGWTSRLWSKIYQEFNTEYAPGVICSSHSVIELGIGGDDIVGVSKRFERELFTRVDFTDPQEAKDAVVGIAVGVNDSRIVEDTGRNFVEIEMYQSVYELVVDRLKEIGVNVFLVGLNPADETKVRPCQWIDEPTSYVNKEIEKYNEVISSIADGRDVLFADVLPVFKNEIATNGPDSLLSDGIHPNAKGHELIALEVFNTIKNIL